MTLSGGHGRLQSFFGLMIDYVLSHRVVLAKRDIVTASLTENSDLFYALRGAGANFGVVTETVYKTHDDPAPKGVYNDVDMVFTGDKLEAVLAIIK